MSGRDWTGAGALEIAAAVKAGRTSAEAVVRQALCGVAALDRSLNAFTRVLTEDAIADAQALDAMIAAGEAVGPLAGVPFAVKNLFDIEGVTTLAGSKIRVGAPQARADATLISRLKAAGAILLGALNMDEFAYGFVTENAHYGPTHNPHDLSRIAGGSSGGSAAIVAAGLAPLALGSDTNGSIRVPASLCGVFGLKPTLGRLSRAGMFPFVDSLDHAGLFARTTVELAAAYDVMQGPDPGDPGCVNRPVERVAEALDALAERPMRVGVLGGWFVQGAFPEVLESLVRVADALDAKPVETPGAVVARSAAFCLSAYEGARLHLEDLRRRPHDFDLEVRDRLLAGALLPDEVVQAARAYRVQFRAEVARLFADYDLLLAPATPCAAPGIGQATMALNGEPVSVRKNLGAYTQPISFIGLPVLAGPVNRPGQLPVGVQLIAPPWREDLALAAALRLERLKVLGAHPPAAIG